MKWVYKISRVQYKRIVQYTTSQQFQKPVFPQGERSWERAFLYPHPKGALQNTILMLRGMILFQNRVHLPNLLAKLFQSREHHRNTPVFFLISPILKLMQTIVCMSANVYFYSKSKLCLTIILKVHFRMYELEKT